MYLDNIINDFLTDQLGDVKLTMDEDNARDIYVCNCVISDKPGKRRDMYYHSSSYSVPASHYISYEHHHLLKHQALFLALECAAKAIHEDISNQLKAALPTLDFENN